MFHALINRYGMNAVQVCESGCVLKKFPSISVIRLFCRYLQRMRGLSEGEMRTFHAIFTHHHLLQLLKLREILSGVRFNGGNLVIGQVSTNSMMMNTIMGWIMEDLCP